MAYTPTEWKKGDIVTSEKLNKLENGVAGVGGGLVVNVTEEGTLWTCDKTWQEIYDAIVSGVVVYLSLPVATEGDEDIELVNKCDSKVALNQYYIRTAGSDNHFVATSVDGYPSISFD